MVGDTDIPTRFFLADNECDRTNNATLELIIEEAGFNNSLAGYLNCPNANEESGGKKARTAWVNVYLQNGEFSRTPSGQTKDANVK